MKRGMLILSAVCGLLCLTACGGESKVKPRDTESATLEGGIQAVEDGEYEKAIIMLTKVLEEESENAEAYVYRGDAYMYAGEERIENFDEEAETSVQKENAQIVEEYLNYSEEDYEQAEAYNYENVEYVQQQKEKLKKVVIAFEQTYSEILKGDEIAAKNALDQMEYAMIISALREMGCEDVSWDLADADGDGSKELYMTAYADTTYRQSQLLADADGPYMTAHVATGAAGSSEYISINGFDGYILQDGYYSAASTRVNYYEWSGSLWEEISPATDNCEYAVFSNPDLTCAWLNMEWDQAVSLIDDELLNRENYMGNFKMDMDDDGIEEHVYFYQGAANRWFGRLKSDSNFGSEYYLNYRDYSTTAIVANWNAERQQTCLRIANFGLTYDYEVTVEGNIMNFDGADYAYQKEGVPFLYQGAYEGETLDYTEDMKIDLEYITLILPAEWQNKCVIVEDGLSVELYEMNEFNQSGLGYIKTIGLSTEYESNHPNRNLYASVEANGIIYYLYITGPTDVPYMDMENVSAGMAISEEITLEFLMDRVQAKEGYILEWFIG